MSKIVRKSIKLNSWINQKTKDSETVIELGAGFFKNLANVNSHVKQRIGIEIWKPYIDNAIYHDCIKIFGDIFNYRKLIESYQLDTVLIVDVLEHFERKKAIELITLLKEDFNRILLMIPEGNYVQNSDVTGFGAHEYQTHRSSWHSEDFVNLEFNEVILDADFHKNYAVNTDGDSGVLFCEWIKNGK